MYVLISLTYLTQPPTPLPYVNHQFFLCIYESGSVLLCLFIYFVS